MMWVPGLENGAVNTREKLPFILAGRRSGSIETGRIPTGVEDRRGDSTPRLPACAGSLLDRPVVIATNQIEETRNSVDQA